MSKYTKNAKTLLDELVKNENISETDKNILIEILRSGESKTYARESDNSSFDLVIPESEIDTIIKDIKLRERTDYLTHESEKFLNAVNEIKKEFNKFISENKTEFTNKINEFIIKAEEIVNKSQVKNSYKSILLDEIIEPLKNISEENVNKIINQLGLNEVSNAKVEQVEESKKEKKSSKKALKETKNDDIIESEDIEDDFRRIQEEGRREFNQSSWERRSKRNNEELRRRISTNFQREMERRGYNSSTFNELILKSNKNTEFRLYENIDGKLFHDFFEISRTYLENGELVDLHENYNNDTCYLSDDGLSGFAITKEGDLISVFNVNKPKHGFLSAISSIVKEKAKTLDCYASENQNLQEMYTAKFGFKTASIMDYNMDYDHDDIAKNHNMPQVAFMVNTNAEVETKSFNKNQYNEAKAYQLSFINNEAKETSKVKTKNDDIIESEDIEDDFRRIQEESRGMSSEELQLFHGASKEIDEALRTRLSRVFRKEIQSRSSINTNGFTLLKDTNNYKVYSNVDGELFHDIFEICRTYLPFGEVVDLHENYDNDTCYLSDDGLSGFAITKEGDLISVFNLNPKGGWLKSISNEIKQKAKTLDCYASKKHPLQEMYTDKFGFKTASIMDYNMDYDHDDIAKNHNNPKVAFMVNTNAEVETKSFNKNQYNEAKAYQLSFINNEAKETSKVKTKNDDIIESEDIEDDFRRIQEESRRTPSEEVQLYHGASEEIDSTLRTRLSRVFKREIQSSRSSSGNDSRILKNTGNFKVIKNVDPKLFHDIFEINRIYLENDELVDLHENYNNDGLSSFAITKEDILIHFLFKIANR